MAPTGHLNMVPIHVSRGVPEEAVGDEAVGVHAVDEWKGSLGVAHGGGKNKVRLSPGLAALPHLLPRQPPHPSPGPSPCQSPT